MGRRDRLVFQRVVPRAARGARAGADRLRAHEARPRRALRRRRRSGSSSRRTASTPPSPRPDGARDELQRAPYALAVGAIQERKNQLAALAAAREAGLELVVVGPTKDERVAARAPRGRRAARGLRPDRAARRALPRRRVPRPGVALRGLRAAGRRGDGVRDAGRHRARPGARRGRRRRGRRRPRGRARRRDPPRARGARPARRGRARAGARLHVGGDGDAPPSRVYVEALGAMSVSAVVVSHGHARRARDARSRVLAPQVDELVVVANRPGSVPHGLPAGVRVLENARAAAARRRTSTSASPRRRASGCSSSNPDVVPERRRRRRAARLRRDARALRDRRPAHRSGRTGRWQPTRRRFPTVSGTLVRRTPLRRLLPAARAPARRTTTSTRTSTEPVEADWLLGAFLLLRRAMLDELGGWDEGYRHYVEDIDLCYRAMRAGWERWYVPAARRDARLGAGDRPAVPLAAHALARAEHGAASSASTPRRWRGCDAEGRTSTRARPRAGRTPSTRTRAPTSTHRAELIASLGVPLDAGDEVLDLACGDGGLGEHLLARGLRYTGIDAEPAMVDAARRRLGDAARRSGSATSTPSCPPARSRRRRSSARSTTRTTVAAFFARVARVHGAEARLRPEPAPVPRSTTSSPSSEEAGFGARRAAPVLRPADAAAPRPRGRRSRRPPSARGRSRGSRCARGSRTSSPPAAASAARRRTRPARRARGARRRSPSGRPSPARTSGSRPRRATGPSGVGSAIVRAPQAGT